MSELDSPIQLFVPTYAVDECLAEIRECLEVGWTGLGFKTVKFEDAWRTYTGLPHAHFVNSATAGLHLALRLYRETLGWKAGDEIISTPLTFVSTNHAILYEGLKPVFADVDDTLCLDPRSVDKLITPRTRAVIYVGMGGNAGRLDEVMDICERRKVLLILDAAHMAGTRYRGTHVGKGIPCSIFSFQAVKNLPIADAGMICFSDKALDAEVRKLSWLGINKDTYARSKGEGGYKWHYDVEYVGLKAHGSSVMASIGLVQLKYLDRDNARRRAVSAQYEKLLSGCPGVGFVEQLGDCESSRHLFQIRVPGENRDPLIEFLQGRKIHPGVHYRVNSRYRMYREWWGKCPRAEKADEELVSLPLHMRLTDGDVKRVCEGIGAFLAEKGKKAA